MRVEGLKFRHRDFGWRGRSLLARLEYGVRI